MEKKEIIKELREILKVYHYKSDNENMSKDVVTSLENLLGQILKEPPKQLELPFPEASQPKVWENFNSKDLKNILEN